MLAGHPLDDALEQHRVIGGAQGIVHMQQVDFKLAYAIFRDRRIGGHALLRAGRIDIAEEGPELVDLVNGEHRIGIKPLAGYRRDGGNGTVFLGIIEIEFKLHGNHRMKIHCRKAFNQARQHPARIAAEWRTVFLAQPQRDEGRGFRRPVHRQDSAPDGLAQAIGVAGGEDQRRILDVLAPDINPHHRQRHAQAPAQHFFRLFNRNALAPHDPVQIAHRRPQAPDFSLFREPAQRIKVVHEVPPFPERILAFAGT